MIVSVCVETEVSLLLTFLVIYHLGEDLLLVSVDNHLDISKRGAYPFSLFIVH